MDFIAISDINLFSAITLAIVYLFTSDYHANETRTRRTFKELTLSVLFLIIMDFVWTFVNGRSGVLFFYLNNFINFFRNAFSILPAMFWVKYVFDRIHYPIHKTKRYVTISTYIFIGTLILTVLSPLFGVIYRINLNNIYSRGALYPALIVISVSYMLTGAWMIIKNKDYYELKKTFSLMSFFVFPMLGLLIQVLYFGVTLVWNFTAVSVFIIYLKIQSKEQTTDYLTGLNTRAAFDNYIKMKVENADKKDFALIMIDIDKFKHINDKYGHKSGDEALSVFSNVLRQTLRSTDFIARYGGDEFVVLIDGDHRELIEDIINRIQIQLDTINASQKFEYNLAFSYGYSFFADAHQDNSDKFIDHVDHLMYQQKRLKVAVSEQR